MKKILVCQHVAYEILGTLNPLFKSHGFRIKYINFGREPSAKPSLEGYSGLVILGGPMNVDEIEKHPHLAHEVELIQKAVEKKMPVLGICLGAQLIAKALGAKVTRHHTKEIGWVDVSLTEEGKKDSLFAHFQTTEKIFQWHSDAFELPKEAVHLASSIDCKHQAFRYGDNVYGFQFHLEVDEPMVHRWLKILSDEVEDAEIILKETHTHIQRLHALALHNFEAFVQLFGKEKKFRGLKSR